MRNITTLGIDLAKKTFQVHGADNMGNKVLTKKLSRFKLTEFVAKLKPCLIGMEACGGAHHWARKFKSFGHEVKLMSPQFVKPYVKGNKNDSADAEAIAEAVTRPTMRFVGIKETFHQDIQSLHRYRERLMKNKTQLTNQIRGLLHEYGIVIAKGHCHVKRKLAFILSNDSADTDKELQELSPLSKELFCDAYEDLQKLEERIKKYTDKIERLAAKDERCKKLLTIPGIGPITATAILAAVGDPYAFDNGRQLAAYFGLVPKHVASGDKIRMLTISKRGDRYIRAMLVHGGRSVVKTVKKKTDKRSLWIKKLLKRCEYNKVTVAVANKNARVVWAILTNDTRYIKDYGYDNA